ncbi:MAG: outer membrane lipoprotein chaperone LolA [Bdellovibrio sp.]|nr:outer membrane lipoprotein chaperone LolA [Bdellovibrio sp.]
MQKKISFLIISLVLFLPLTSLSKQLKIPALLKQVEENYKQSNTLFTKFKQTVDQPLLKKTKTSTGLLLFKRPGKFRWETRSPEPSILVSDGKKIWFYTPPFDKDEHGQIIEKKSTQVQSALMNTLLSGSFSLAKLMKIKKLKRNMFLLIPELGSSGSVQTVEIEINVSKKLIQKMIFKQTGDNITKIDLSEITLGKKLEDSLFHFIPPPGTERIVE